MKLTTNKRLTVITASGRRVWTGSFVTVIALPPGYSTLPRDSRLAFRAIVGCRFRVAAVTVEHPRWVQLDVHRVVDPLLGSFRNSVYLEPECIA
jgi:hypothetical protein